MTQKSVAIRLIIINILKKGNENLDILYGVFYIL